MMEMYGGHLYNVIMCKLIRRYIVVFLGWADIEIMLLPMDHTQPFIIIENKTTTKTLHENSPLLFSVNVLKCFSLHFTDIYGP